MKYLVVILVLVAALAGWVRFAPSDPQRWHKMPESVSDQDLANGALRAIAQGKDRFPQLDKIIGASPRTKRLAGSVSDGMVTYVTRSVVFGFPDYTTLRLDGDRIEIFGRARFGVSDLGVNADRIDGWLRALSQG